MLHGDYVRETTTTTGTGNITTLGPTSAHQGIIAVVAVGDPFEYSLIDANGAREIGIGTVTATASGGVTFSRDTILSSTNGGAAISLSAGSHTVLMSPSAEAINKRPVMADAQIDYVVQGLVVPTTSGTLTGSISAGIAYVVGQRVNKGAQSRTYTASRDTYVDLSNKGVLTFVEVTNGAAAPSITANSMRLGVVVTNGSTIASGTDLRNLLGKPTCILSTTTTQTLAHGTPANSAIFGAGSEVTNNSGMHSTTANPTRVTATVAGLYYVNGIHSIDVIAGNGAATTLVDVTLMVNGTITIGHFQWPVAPAGTSTHTPVSGIYFFNVGDYVELQSIHFTGPGGTAGPQSMTAAKLQMTRIG